MNQDTFLGQWLVSEYVYNPDGNFAGIVRQKRALHQLDDGQIRVIQHCNPEESLNNHPMGKFVGERVFDLKIDGRARRYDGPDVIGTGMTWGDGLMTGQGLWPLFGHNFTSYAATTSPERQVTGGKFFNASEMIANILGIGIEDKGQDYPEFHGPQWPGEVSNNWEGTFRTSNVNGELLSDGTVSRTYETPQLWKDELDKEIFNLRLEDWEPRLRVGGMIGSQVFTGLAKQTGWQLELDIMINSSTNLKIMEILDNQGKQLISLKKRYIDHQLSQITYLHLKPY